MIDFENAQLLLRTLEIPAQPEAMFGDARDHWEALDPVTVTCAVVVNLIWHVLIVSNESTLNGNRPMYVDRLHKSCVAGRFLADQSSCDPSLHLPYSMTCLHIQLYVCLYFPFSMTHVSLLPPP